MSRDRQKKKLLTRFVNSSFCFDLSHVVPLFCLFSVENNVKTYLILTPSRGFINILFLPNVDGKNMECSVRRIEIKLIQCKVSRLG